MTTIKTIASAALVSVAAFASPAQAGVDPFGASTAADFAVEVLDANITLERVTAAATVDELIDDLKARRDDGTLNEEDFRKIRAFETASVSVEELTDRLKARRDDGTLNDQDFRVIRAHQA